MSQVAPPPATGAPAQQRAPHALSLKVLRASLPSLAPSSTPFSLYNDENDPINQLDSNSVLGGPAQGPFSDALLLPASFGTIFLGETFSALLCLSNDLIVPPTPTPTSTTAPPPPPPALIAHSPILKVEMHTLHPTTGAPLSKHHLKTVYAPSSEDRLAPGEETTAEVRHEIKELGVHSLVCTVGYGAKMSGNGEMTSRSFRKVYKFQVSNPLSVRTKAHSPSPTSLLLPQERQKIFLEVQVQNQAQREMVFEKMLFVPLEGWTLVDASRVFPPTPPTSDGDDDGTLPLFSPSTSSSLLPPNHTRQYLYILSAPPSSPLPTPGTSQPLGRLDIEWRTANGEKGRLMTSMLGRKVPGQPPTVPLNLPTVSEVSQTTQPAVPSKGPAPYRPANATSPISPTLPPPPPPPLPLAPPPPPTSIQNSWEYDLTILVSKFTPPASSIRVCEPFTVDLAVDIRASSSSNTNNNLDDVSSKILLQLVVQVFDGRRSRDVSLVGDDRMALSLVELVSSSPTVVEGQPTPTPTPPDATDPANAPPPVSNQGSSSTYTGSTTFRLTFVALERGLLRLGGLRVLLVPLNKEAKEMGRVLWERDRIGDVWVGGNGNE
ncbi:DUF974-domain-containing protein [Meredithblackwellia eburnea MCA 4105]